MRDSFVTYRSFIEALRELPPEEFKAAMLSIADYALDDQENTEPGIVRAMFLMAKPVIDANNQRYENGRKGGRRKTEVEPNPNQTVTKANQTVTEPEPYVDVDVDGDEDLKRDVEREKRKRFTPPTPEEVRVYCVQNGYQVDPERFVDFYSSKGWKVGNQPMKDWKASVRTWVKKEPVARSGTYKPKSNRTQQEWLELERQLVMAQR